MKLRIRGNSVRLRVSKHELDRIATDGFAEDAVQFSPNARLRYRVEVKNGGSVEAELGGELLRVAVPRATVERWLDPAEVSIRAEQPAGDGATLKILVEKDFACLAPRGDEDDEDLFENPQKTARKSRT